MKRRRAKQLTKLNQKLKIAEGRKSNIFQKLCEFKLEEKKNPKINDILDQFDINGPDEEQLEENMYEEL